MHPSLFLASLFALSNAASFKQRAESEKLYTIELGPDDVRTVTEDEKWALKAEHKSFIDITNLEDIPSIKPRATPKYPTKMAQTKAVKALLPKLDQAQIKAKLTTFSNFHNRYYDSTYGQESANWLLQQVQAAVTASGARNVNVTTFAHSFKQPSIIATIRGKSLKTIIVGAHQDSINLFDRKAGRAPGADDNGSGSMTTLEAFRVLLTDSKIASGQATNTIEFHWYAGEEAGLLGSVDIFNKYSQERRDVKAMLNQDMTGFVKEGTKEVIALITDNVDATLTAYVKKVIAAYTSLPAVDTECGYGCSDHASANRVGFPAAFAVESTFEDSHPNIHTPSDTIDYVNFGHALEFAKLELGFAYELGFATL